MLSVCETQTEMDEPESLLLVHSKLRRTLNGVPPSPSQASSPLRRTIPFHSQFKFHLNADLGLRCSQKQATIITFFFREQENWSKLTVSSYWQKREINLKTLNKHFVSKQYLDSAKTRKKPF